MNAKIIYKFPKSGTETTVRGSPPKQEWPARTGLKQTNSNSPFYTMPHSSRLSEDVQTATLSYHSFLKISKGIPRVLYIFYNTRDLKCIYLGESAYVDEPVSNIQTHMYMLIIKVNITYSVKKFDHRRRQLTGFIKNQKKNL